VVAEAEEFLADEEGEVVGERRGGDGVVDECELEVDDGAEFVPDLVDWAIDADGEPVTGDGALRGWRGGRGGGGEEGETGGEEKGAGDHRKRMR
jgi:hypothetical protein